MLLHAYVNEPGEPERACSWVPEKPERIKTIFDKLTDEGLVQRCHRLEARDAKREELLWLHDAEHLDKMEASAKMERTELDKLEKHYDIKDIYLCPETQQAALLAAGSGLQVVDSILSGESRSGVAVIRPPGHHADGHTAYGFCIYNNTALAAKYALEVHNLERVLIVDWDIHHGNGIQKMFEDDPRVLYVSLHRLDTFPWDVDYADCSRIGTGPGTGYNVNIGWPKPGVGDSEYLAAFQRIIMPIAYQFNPQLVLVAAGFDAARGDELGGCDVTPEGYGQMTHLLTSLAGGKVAVLLEGGYNLNSITVSMTACVRALLGDPLPPPKIGTVDPASAAAIQRVIKYHLPYWSNLQLNKETEEDSEALLQKIKAANAEFLQLHSKPEIDRGGA